MSHAPSKAALAAGLQRINVEAAGVIDLIVVRPIDAAEMLADAIAGSAEAMRLFRAISDASDRIAQAPKRTPMLCASCPRPLRGSGYAFVVALPAVDRPEQALAMAVCTCCATEPDAIKAKAVDALRSIWPDLKPIAVTHPGGGRA